MRLLAFLSLLLALCSNARAASAVDDLAANWQAWRRVVEAGEEQRGISEKDRVRAALFAGYVSASIDAAVDANKGKVCVSDVPTPAVFKAVGDYVEKHPKLAGAIGGHSVVALVVLSEFPCPDK